MLIRHPAPKATESFCGYILRLSQVNGLSSIGSISERGGLRRWASNPARSNLQITSLLTKRSVGELENIANFGEHCKESECSVLRRPIPKYELNFAHPKICPLCIVEKGFIEAHFDLKLLYACPVHRVELVYRCPECRKPLSWFRPSLLKCRCGADLSQSEQPKLPKLECELLDCIRSKALGAKSLTDPKRRLLPSSVHSLGLRDLLALIRFLARRSFDEKLDRESKEVRTAISAAAGILGDWPGGLHEWLEGYKKRGDLSLGPKRSDGSLRDIYDLLVKRREGIITKAGEALLRQVLAPRAIEQQRCRGSKTTASQLGCRATALPGLIKRGLLEGYYKSTRLMITVSSINEFRANFTFLALLNKNTGISSRGILKLCRTNGISVQFAHNSERGGEWPFIRNEDLTKFGLSLSLALKLSAKRRP